MISLSTALFAITLAWVPPPEDTFVSAQDAIDRSNSEPREAIADLERVLEALEDLRQEMAGDEVALLLRRNVQLSLARCYLYVKQPDKAQHLIDDVIRDAMGDAVAIEDYGPSMTSLYEERAKVLRAGGTGRIEVTCGVPCQVFIQERESTPTSKPLVLGDYRVLVRPIDGGRAALRAQIEIGRDGRTEPLAYALDAMPPQDISPTDPPVDSASPVDSAPLRRLAPRWLEVSGVVLGVALVATGAVLFYFDGKCPGGFDPIENSSVCPKLYDNKVAGAATLAVGGAALMGFGAVLVVDEVRDRKARASTVVLSWQLRF